MNVENRGEDLLLTTLREFLMSRPEISHVEAARIGHRVRVRLWKRDGLLVTEILRALFLACLLTMAGCGMLAGIDEYSAARPLAAEHDGGADGADPPDAPPDAGPDGCGGIGQACCIAPDHKPELCGPVDSTCNYEAGVCEHCGLAGEICCMGLCAPGIACVVGVEGRCYADGGTDG